MQIVLTNYTVEIVINYNFEWYLWENNLTVATIKTLFLSYAKNIGLELWRILGTYSFKLNSFNRIFNALVDPKLIAKVAIIWIFVIG